MRGTTWAALTGALAITVSAAHADPEDIQTHQLEGTVGTHAIGMTLTIGAKNRFFKGHYFYDSQLKDIPLTGTETGPRLTLQEPGGGVFHVTLQGNGSNGSAPLDFDTSVAAAGTWTLGAQSLPVTLQLESSYDGAPSGHLYADVTQESDAAFEARVRRFLEAALAGDRAEAARLVSYPLAVNGKHTRTFRDAAQLIAAWDQVFTPALLAQLKSAVPHEMFVRNGQAMVAGGAAWFDAKGAMAINEP